MRLKVSKWEMDADNKAILYIKDNDDNPKRHEILADDTPIAEIECVNNDVEVRKFYKCKVIKIELDTKDGDFLTHPLIISYDTFEDVG